MTPVKILKFFLTACLIFLPATAFSLDITLSWDASPSNSVTGYYVYYQQGSSILPLSGTDADQGASPVDVGSNLSVTLTGLEDDAIYYFTVTAYDSGGNESSYSNIVSNAPTVVSTPELLFPENNTTNEPVSTSFEWEGLDSSYDVSYRLVYGTNSSEVSAAGSIPSFPGNPLNTPSLLIFLFGLGLVFVPSLKSKLKTKHWLAASICSALLLSACGGGGGGGSSSASKTVTTSSSDDSILVSVDTGSDLYYYVDNLSNSTTYYWKVIAIDNSDPTVFYESDVYQFTTESQE